MELPKGCFEYKNWETEIPSLSFLYSKLLGLILSVRQIEWTRKKKIEKKKIWIRNEVFFGLHPAYSIFIFINLLATKEKWENLNNNAIILENVRCRIQRRTRLEYKYDFTILFGLRGRTDGTRESR